jgi:hypothetical protein
MRAPVVIRQQLYLLTAADELRIQWVKVHYEENRIRGSSVSIVSGYGPGD